MNRITTKERRRRMTESIEAAWGEARQKADDPGLRDRYHLLPRAPIRLIGSPLTKDVNQGGLLRLAEAFRIERVDLSPEADGAVDFAGSRGTKSQQPYRWVETQRAVEEANAEGYHTVALTLSSRAVPFDLFEWRFPLAIVIGAELAGLPEEIETACQHTVAIPLYGMIQSLNVAVATGIVLQRAHAQYVAEHPEFEPARQVSRRLRGL